MVYKEKEELSILAVKEGVSWYYDIVKFQELGIYLDNANKKERRLVRMMAKQYVLCGGQLNRRSYGGIHLHCLKREAERGMEEIR